MTATEILLITVNVLIVLGVAYVFTQVQPEKGSQNRLEDVLHQKH